MQVLFKVKVGADETYNAGTVEAETKEAAIEKLDQFYGVSRSKAGDQTNSESVKVLIISPSEFASIEESKGKELTHKL